LSTGHSRGFWDAALKGGGSQDWLPHMEDLSAVTAIKKWFGWQFTVSDRFLSNPNCGAQG
jgi:hypothetical protein